MCCMPLIWGLCSNGLVWANYGRREGDREAMGGRALWDGRTCEGRDPQRSDRDRSGLELYSLSAWGSVERHPRFFQVVGRWKAGEVRPEHRWSWLDREELEGKRAGGWVGLVGVFTKSNATLPGALLR